MDFWKDIWPTLIAPFIVVILTPIANAIGNKMFKNWGFKGVLAILIILALTLFFFLKFITVNLSTTIILGLYSSILTILSYLTFEALTKQKRA